MEEPEPVLSDRKNPVKPHSEPTDSNHGNHQPEALWKGGQPRSHLGRDLGCLSSTCGPQLSLQMIRKDSKSLSRIHEVIHPRLHVAEIVREHKGLTLQPRPQKQLLDSQEEPPCFIDTEGCLNEQLVLLPCLPHLFSPFSSAFSDANVCCSKNLWLIMHTMGPRM